MENSKNLITELKEGSLEFQGLDVEAGIAVCGTLDMYKKVLAVFCTSIEKKSNLLEKYMKEGNVQAYTIEVHGLKSTSKSIGAKDLSQMAAKLEACGMEGDIESIKNGNEELLKCYRAYIGTLKPYCKEEKEEPSVSATKDEMLEKIIFIEKALDEFDINAANKNLEELQNYKLSEEDSKMRGLLKEAVEAVEYDEALDIIRKWK